MNHSRNRRPIVLLFITLFQIMIGFGVVWPLMPFLARELGGTPLQLGLVTTAWAGAQFLFSPVWGNLSDRIGRRPVLLLGLLSYCFTFGFMGIVTNMWQLVAVRALGGALSAATIPAAQAYIADLTTGQERSRGMAAMGAAMNLGFLLGPGLGALLAPFGLRISYFIVATLAFLNLIATYFMLPEPPERQSKGSLRVTGIGAVGLALKGPHALFFLLTFVATFGGSAMFSMVGQAMIDRIQATESLTGIAFVVDGAAAALVQGVLLGLLLRRLGEEKLVRLALFIAIGGFGVLAFAQSLWTILLSIVLIACGVSLLRPTVTALVSQHTTLEQGMTMGVQTSFDALGRSLGPLWAGWLYGLHDSAPFISSGVLYLATFAYTGLAFARRTGFSVRSSTSA